MPNRPTVRWGIITTGMISSWFVDDLLLEREDSKVEHVIQAIGTSNAQRGQDFVKIYCQGQSPRVYDTYEEVYRDANVDIVYIGTPHGLHFRDCMQAISAAAREKNVYVAEAMWLRHRPIFIELQRLLHEEKIIGDVFRVFSDFASGVDIASLPSTSRYRDLTLGAGSLLDIGVYSLTWARMALGGKTPDQSEMPRILAAQTHEEGIEITTSTILQYASTGQQGIVTSTTKALGAPGEVFAVIHGTNGYIEIEGRTPSAPESFTVWSKQEGNPDRAFFPREACQGKKYEFATLGRGFVHEAENTALDILEGRKQSTVMPWAETIYIMDIMDEIRRQGNTTYPGE
ncbi:hypothetical protein N7460_013317 [Penicillium canescens]|uniref:D-xylose 1-dehydrogenase (NADP(+), D-xylono-1,5-lactone-forming) n=1 Tax=Penicillium canescens TaxID=5083 RepID=A0AAD6HZQ3_PENCN|nr:hypothetical protein N7460_013317 [Penicillium canescens]KAJ6025816.1 hypothetical protein N7444_013495 [Penicillium canescens]